MLTAAVAPNKLLDAPVKNSRDPNFGVRNNAVRGLGVLATSSRDVAARIPATGFIEMLNSGTWTDRNKSVALLTDLTASRNLQLLALLRSQALDSLIEMARWQSRYALTPRIILGRIAGIDEKRLEDLTANDPAEIIIAAAEGK